MKTYLVGDGMIPYEKLKRDICEKIVNSEKVKYLNADLEVVQRSINSIKGIFTIGLLTQPYYKTVSSQQ